MKVLGWLVVLVMGCFGETPNQAFPGEFGNLGVSVTSGSGFHLGEHPLKLVVLVVLLLMLSGFALLCYSWWGKKKRHSGKKREVISARFADVWMLGNFLSNSGKRCGECAFHGDSG